MYDITLWLWMGYVNQQGNLLPCFNFISRIFLTEVNSFNSNVGYLESHNNLDLEIMLNAPTQTDLIVSTMNQLALVLDEKKAINGAHAKLKQSNYSSFPR